MGRPRGTGERGEQTRAKILHTAERLFAEKGFAETRLDDVAEAVGVRRAALVYYFPNKEALYDAVLADVFGGLVRHMVAASDVAACPVARIEAMAEAWVDYVAARPATARLYLREVVNTAPEHGPATAQYLKTVYEHTDGIVRAGARDGVLRRINTVHLLGMVAGATLLFTLGMPASGVEPSYDPFTPREMRAHRDEILRMTRGLLVPGPRQSRPAVRAESGNGRMRRRNAAASRGVEPRLGAHRSVPH